jgi:hypothetical protein
MAVLFVLVEHEVNDLRERQAELRRQAREWAYAGNKPALNDTLIDLNIVRVLIESPMRVAQRGNIEPYRFR